MKARWLLNLALLALVAGLGWFVYIKPKPDQPQAFRLTSLEPGQIRQVTIEKAGQPAVRLEKRGANWFVTAPYPARAETLQVLKTLELLGATSKQRLAAGELGRFDLDHPHTRITLGMQSFSFGTVNPLTGEQYVLTQDGVYLLPSRYLAAVPTRPDDFVSHRLLADNEVLTGIELRGLALSQRDGRWSLTPSRPGLSQDDLSQWVSEWQLASSLATQPFSGKPQAEPISLTLKSGQAITLQILQRAPELILLRSDENLQYIFSADNAKRLLELQPDNPAREH